MPATDGCDNTRENRPPVHVLCLQAWMTTFCRCCLFSPRYEQKSYRYAGGFLAEARGTQQLLPYGR
jgi:hypothetical protein